MANQNGHRVFACAMLFTLASLLLYSVGTNTYAGYDSGTGNQPPTMQPAECYEPWETTACSAAGAADGVVCDDLSICDYDVVSDPEMIYYRRAQTGYDYPILEVIPSICLINRKECNPFGEPSCIDSELPPIQHYLYEADFSLVASCP